MPIGKSRNSKFLKLVPGFFGTSGIMNSFCINVYANKIRAINCSLPKGLCKSLSKSTEERRTAYSSLLNFFKNPNKESNFSKNLETTLTKFELKALILLKGSRQINIFSYFSRGVSGHI